LRGTSGLESFCWKNPVVKRLTDRFGDEASACGSLADLGRLLADASRELGFHFFALLHHASVNGTEEPYVRIDNYPEEWVAELLGSEFAREDPVHLASRRMNAGFSWSEIGSVIRLDDRHRRILARSRHHGIGAGFTVPANVPGEPSGSCSFAVERGSELPRLRLMCAELIGAHAFRAARRIHHSTARPARPHLSRREIQCLRLLALGKTDWEIATILGIGVETARQYVKRARSAYGVASRTQLVVYGLRDDWLTFEEAAPFRRIRRG
jgi:LuxR family transcriptional regulator, quorum-sensing system regulator CciR